MAEVELNGMITKLADKWRKFRFSESAETIGPLWQVGYIDCLGHVSDQLREALPFWTKITDDPDTWPEDGQRVLFYQAQGALHVIYSGDFHTVGIHRHWMHRTWRPLCDLDYPPEQS